MTYEQFLTGELTTIVPAEEVEEQVGCTELLQRITLWKLRANVSWAQVRNVYAHIMRKIENREINWDADWDRYERHIYDKIATNNNANSNKGEKIQKGNRNKDPETVWFCKPYQRDACSKELPHPGKVGNLFRQMHHICATCYFKDKAREPHPEVSPECPYKKA